MARVFVGASFMLAAMGFGGGAFGQELPKLEKDLTSLLVQSVAKKRFVGLSILVLTKDGGRYEQHMGYRDLERRLEPNADTLYEIGSLSKVFTRLAVASQSRIGANDLLSQHLPASVRSPKPFGEEYSILNLMTHTAFTVEHPCTVRADDPKRPVCHGIDPKAGHKNPYGVGTRETTYAFVNEYSHSIDDFPWSYPVPGTFRTYSNVSLGLVGEVLADAHDVSYEQFIKTKLLKPLGMTRTTITMPCYQNHSCPNVADPHLRNPETKLWQPWLPFTMPGLPGAGAMLSSLKDLGQFLAVNMAPEHSPLEPVITLGQSLLADVTVTHNSNICIQGETPETNLCNPYELRYNYAWQPQRVGEATFYHEGRTTGSEAIIMFTEDRSAGVVVLTNSSQIALPEGVRYHLPELVAKCALQMLGKVAAKPDACVELKLKP